MNLGIISEITSPWKWTNGQVSVFVGIAQGEEIERSSGIGVSLKMEYFHKGSSFALIYSLLKENPQIQ